MTRRGVSALGASPVLVGAVTVLVTIVAVFLSYNANSGLPFVPTYDLNANLPNAANLVRGNDVRIGGARVGTVSTIDAERNSDGTTYAQVHLKLDKDLEPLPADSTLVIRPRSALGLKYIELTPGTGKAGLKSGTTVPISQASPRPVELDEVLNTFDARTRKGAQGQLQGFGEGFAGRGQSLNAAIPEILPLLNDLEPVAKNLSSPQTRLDRFFPSLAAVAGEVAPVAEEQAALFGNLDTTFAALASVARPFLQEFISQSPPTEDVGIAQFPR
ncbi:MAG: MlaD family protein, partial [Thermoleophilaceae bacterium]